MGERVKGKVYLIGAGPGDPGLITVKGLRCLEEADVVVYDRLVGSRLLDRAREGAELVYVGKGPDSRAMEQDDINRCLVDRAKEGKIVTRLKGGDPFVFGRGGEEAQALAQAGIPFEVVPGVTSAIAAPAYAGIPLTHRDIASSFTVVTGSEDPSKVETSVRWDRLAQSGGTLVVLMGWAAMEGIIGKLVHEGMAPSTPVALVQWGTEPHQLTVTGNLENILEKAGESGLSPPVVVIVGGVVDLRSEVRWFDNRPLTGVKVLVTRSRDQASVLSEMLRQEGAEAIEVPTIRIVPMEDHTQLDGAIRSLGKYGWVIFTSANGVEAFFDRVYALGKDSRVLGGLELGVIGPATARALALRGICADLVPSEFASEALVRALEDHDLESISILMPRADIAGDELTEGLTRMGALVDSVAAYRTVPVPESKEMARTLLESGSIDLVTFTSSSTVGNLLGLLDGESSLLKGVQIACIGPVTAKAVEKAGLGVSVMAQEYTVAGLVSAVKAHFEAKNGARSS